MESKTKYDIYQDLNREDRENILFNYIITRNNDVDITLEDYKKQAKEAPVLVEEYFYDLYNENKLDHYIEEYLTIHEKLEMETVKGKDELQKDEFIQRLIDEKVFCKEAEQIIRENIKKPERAYDEIIKGVNKIENKALLSIMDGQYMDSLRLGIEAEELKLSSDILKNDLEARGCLAMTKRGKGIDIENSLKEENKLDWKKMNGADTPTYEVDIDDFGMEF